MVSASCHEPIPFCDNNCLSYFKIDGKCCMRFLLSAKKRELWKLQSIFTEPTHYSFSFQLFVCGICPNNVAFWRAKPNTKAQFDSNVENLMKKKSPQLWIGNCEHKFTILWWMSTMFFLLLKNFPFLHNARI